MVSFLVWFDGQIQIAMSRDCRKREMFKAEILVKNEMRNTITEVRGQGMHICLLC